MSKHIDLTLVCLPGVCYAASSATRSVLPLQSVGNTYALRSRNLTFMPVDMGFLRNSWANSDLEEQRDEQQEERLRDSDMYHYAALTMIFSSQLQLINILSNPASWGSPLPTQVYKATRVHSNTYG